MKLDKYSVNDNVVNIPVVNSNVWYWILDWENSVLLADWLSFKASFDASSVFLKDHPLEFVTSIKAYPFDLSSLFTVTEDIGITIGNITKNDIRAKKVLKYNHENPYIDCGFITIPKKYDNFLDFYPFTKVMLYLPFIGTVELNTNQVMGKVVNIKYSIDALTGKCCAFILDDNETVIGSYNGSMGVSIPLVASDYSNIIRNLSLSAISFAMSGAFNIASGATSNMITNVVNAASNAGDLNNQILSNAYVAEQYANKGFEISSSYRERGRGRLYEAMNVAPSHSKFTISESFIDWFYPHKVTAIIQRPIIKYPSSYNHEYGKPLMETNTLKELEGFTIVDSVHMDGFTCTDEELSMIERLLFNGVILGDKLPVGLFDIYVNSINATYSNNSAQAESGSSYVNTFTPNEGYTLEGVEPRIVMNDEAVIGAYTYDADSDTITINIPEVRGNIIIGVAAVEKEAQRFTIQITAENTVVTDLSSGQVVISSDQGTFSKDVVEGIPISFQFGTKYSGGNFSRLYAESAGNDLSELFDLTESTDIIKVYEFNYTPTANVNIDVIATKPITYTITNALTNVVTNADFDEINEGIPYDAVLSGEGNYSMYEADVQVMMGGVDITSTAYTPANSPTTNGIIHIDSVNGNIEIYAQAEKQKTYNVAINLENAVNISGFDSNTVELYAPIDAWYTGAFGYKLVTIPTIKIGGVLQTNKYYTLDTSTGQIHIEIPQGVIDGNVEISIVATKEYSITRNFTNVAIESGSADDEIVGGETYSVNIKGIIGGYVITTYTVMMGSVNVTSQYSTFNQSTGIVSINIPSVNGDIVITANAEIPEPKTFSFTIKAVNCLVYDSDGDLVLTSSDNNEEEYVYNAEPDENVIFTFQPIYANSTFVSYTANGSTNDFNLSGTGLVYDTIANENTEIIVAANKPNIYTVTFNLTNIDVHQDDYDGTVIVSSDGTGKKIVTMQFTEGSHGYWYFTRYKGDSGYIVDNPNQSIFFVVNQSNGDEWVSASWTGADLISGSKSARWNSYINQDFTIIIRVAG